MNKKIDLGVCGKKYGVIRMYGVPVDSVRS